MTTAKSDYERARRAAMTPEQKAAFNRRQKAYRLARNTELVEAALSSGCADCGEQDPIVLEFDHVPERGEKRFNIKVVVAHKNKGALEAEIAKCDVVCANCHRRRTARRRNGG